MGGWAETMRPELGRGGGRENERTGGSLAEQPGWCNGLGSDEKVKWPTCGGRAENVC